MGPSSSPSEALVRLSCGLAYLPHPHSKLLSSTARPQAGVRPTSPLSPRAPSFVTLLLFPCVSSPTSGSLPSHRQLQEGPEAAVPLSPPGQQAQGWAQCRRPICQWELTYHEFGKRRSDVGVRCLHKLLPLRLTQGQWTDRLCTDELTRVALNTLLLTVTGSHPSRAGVPAGGERPCRLAHAPARTRP